MKFDDLDAKMRRFETAHDHCVLPGLYMVARLDGRSFTRLTRELHEFEAPFDVGFRDMMVATVKHVMEAGFRIVYGYTQSDEISLLFHRDASPFGRKLRKLDSVLAGEASAQFSVQLGSPAAFDCRISQLPTSENVVEYFRWRAEDAHRNALNAHCYWMLRGEGQRALDATAALKGVSVSAKNELLFERGINFNDLPTWQKRGIGVYSVEVEREGFNPVTEETTVCQRRELRVDLELPRGDEYGEFVAALVS
jgi:tRNA(His) guanylyltransferase